MNWEILKIKDLGKIITGKTPCTNNRSFFDGEFQFVTPTDITFDNYYCRKTETTVTEAAKQKHRNQFIPPDSIMVTCIGSTIGKCALSSKECLTNQQINSIVPFDIYNPKYVYYLMIFNIEIIRGIGLSGGVAAPIINKAAFERIKIKLPSKESRDKIATILSAYDDLIDINRRRIRLLKEAARLLFREWFVYFRFPGHEKIKIVDGMPEGWRKENLGRIGYLNYGKSLVEEMRMEGDFKVYGSSGVVGFHSKPLVEGPGIIVGRKGNVGAVYWVNENYWPIDTVYYIKKEQSNLFLYLSLKTIGFINTDASVPGLNRDYAHSKTILIPSKDLLGKFLNQVNDIYDMINFLAIQNQKLAQARDLLLPRLMSGKIEV